MVQAGSDDWEIVPTHHDVLSCSDTETSEGGENDSRAAAAIIEALEDNRQANLQDLRLGFLPQVLGGWYGSSTPAAGQTYTVDLTPAPAESNSTAVETADVASHDAVAQTSSNEPETYEDTQLEQPADEHVEKEPLSDVSDLTHPTVPSSSIAATGAGSTAALSNAVLLCLLSATLAFLLVLLGAAAGNARHALPTHAPAQFGLTRSSLLYAGLPMRVPADTEAGVTADKGGEGAPELPWWLRYNASWAAWKAGQGSQLQLDALPPSLQLVAEGSVRANMSASQRLRLHLWLLHCAARDTGNTQQHRQEQVASVSPASVPIAPYPWTITPRCVRPTQPPAYPWMVMPAHASRPTQVPSTQQCALPGTPRGFYLASPSAAGFKPAGTIQNPTMPAASQGAGQDGAQHALDSVLSFLQPLSSSSSSCRRPARRRSTRAVSSGCNAAICFAFKCRPGDGNATRTNPAVTEVPSLATLASLAAPPPAAAPFAHEARSASKQPQAPAAPTALNAHPTASQQTYHPVIVQPTRPVPPFYRPPLPCLQLGGWRPRHAAAQAAATAQHSTAAPVCRTKTWPNITARHQQGFVQRSWAKPYGRSLAMGMARWGWNQQAPFWGAGSAASLPTFPPTTQPLQTAANRSSTHTPNNSNRKHAAPVVAAGASFLQLVSVATDVPNCSSAQGQQQQAGGLTLPMLPPANSTRSFLELAAAAVRPAATAAAAKSQAAAATAPLFVSAGAQHSTATSASTGTSISTTVAAGSVPKQTGEVSVWDQLIKASSGSADRANGQNSGTHGTCKAATDAEPLSAFGFILVHRLQQPSAAAAAAASAARYARQYNTQQQGVAGDVPTMQASCTAVPAQELPSLLEYVETTPSDTEVTAAAAVAAAAADDMCEVLEDSSAVDKPAQHFHSMCRAEACHGVDLHGSTCEAKHAGQSALQMAAATSIQLLRPLQHSIVYSTSRAIPLPPAQAEPKALAMPAWAGAGRCLAASAATEAASAAAAPARMCANQGTMAVALAAAAKLAALAPAASAPLRRASAPPSLLSQLAVQTCTSNDSMRACTAPQLLPAELAASTPAAASTAGSADADSNRGSSTGWVAALVTLPMLPPAREEYVPTAFGVDGEGDVCASFDFDTDINLHTGMDADGMMGFVPSHDHASCIATFASDNEARQPMWLNPVM